jgi:putative membrane protein
MLRVALLLLTLWLSVEALAANPSFQRASTPLSSSTRFTAAATAIGQFEIDSSQRALERGASARVKAFAGQMVDTHRVAAMRLHEALSVENLAAPSLELDPRHKEMVEDLRNKHGAAFDYAYVTGQRRAHDEAIALFQGYSQSGENVRLRALAARQLPMLRRHREALDEVLADALDEGP